MGRAKKQSIRGKKKVSFKTKKEREKWQENKSNPRWRSLQDYKPVDRLWIVTKAPVNDLFMVDAQSFVDEDGDHLYRMVHQVDKAGRVTQKYGFVNVFDSWMIRADQVESVVDEKTAKQLDAWIKSAKEDVQYTTAHGFVDRKVELEP